MTGVQTCALPICLACALERYRLANGQFPETLDALVPKFVAKLPTDVITGTPLKYRRSRARTGRPLRADIFVWEKFASSRFFNEVPEPNLTGETFAPSRNAGFIRQNRDGVRILPTEAGVPGWGFGRHLRRTSRPVAAEA